MKIYQIIFFFIVTFCVAPTLNGGHDIPVANPLEELISELGSYLEDGTKEVDDEIILSKVSRRNSSQNSSDLLLINSKITIFGNRIVQPLRLSITNYHEVFLVQNEEISFIHRFQLY